jgi:hypothetical protein
MDRIKFERPRGTLDRPGISDPIDPTPRIMYCIFLFLFFVLFYFANYESMMIPVCDYLHFLCTFFSCYFIN